MLFFASYLYHYFGIKTLCEDKVISYVGLTSVSVTLRVRVYASLKATRSITISRWSSNHRQSGWTDAAIVELNGYFNFPQRQPKKTFTLLIATLVELCKRPVIPTGPYFWFQPLPTLNFSSYAAVFKLVFIHASPTQLSRETLSSTFAASATSFTAFYFLFLYFSRYSSHYCSHVKYTFDFIYSTIISFLEKFACFNVNVLKNNCRSAS